MANTKKLKLTEGQDITINLPFTYTIGETGFHTGNVLRTIEDCKNEVIAEVNSWTYGREDLFMEVKTD